MNWLVVVDLILLSVVFLLSTYTLSMKHRIDHIESWLEDHFDGDIDLDSVAKEFGFIFDDEEDDDESEKS